MDEMFYSRQPRERNTVKYGGGGVLKIFNIAYYSLKMLID